MLKNEIGHEVEIVDCEYFESRGFRLFAKRIDADICGVKMFEVKNNNWREAFNKLVASFPDEIMKNTNHHAGLTL